jgi:hypothetical protein
MVTYLSASLLAGLLAAAAPLVEAGNSGLLAQHPGGGNRPGNPGSGLSSGGSAGNAESAQPRNDEGGAKNRDRKKSDGNGKGGGEAPREPRHAQ